MIRIDNQSVHSVRLSFAEDFSNGSSDDNDQEDTKSQDKVTHF